MTLHSQLEDEVFFLPLTHTMVESVWGSFGHQGSLQELGLEPNWRKEGAIEGYEGGEAQFDSVCVCVCLLVATLR